MPVLAFLFSCVAEYEGQNYYLKKSCFMVFNLNYGYEWSYVVTDFMFLLRFILCWDLR